MTGSDTKLLRAKNLHVVFGQGPEAVTVLRDFSLQVRAGEIAGLVGEPGSGKSTAALALLGLARSGATIEGGEVWFGDRDLLALSAAELREVRGGQIGLITQNPRSSLHPLLDVGTQIANVCRAHDDISRGNARTQASRLLGSVGINDPKRRLAAFPHELSTGMAQRIVIAMAMAAKPKLLIADEPTSGLDVTIQAQLLDKLWDSARGTGSSVLLITQDLGIIANYCDQVFVIHDGAVVEQQPAKRFFTAPQHPYSQRILALQQEESVAEQAGSVAGAAGSVLVSVRDLRKTFPIKSSRAVVQAIDRVSFDIRRGESFGLVGESGSGKTTVGRTVLCLETASEGEVIFDDKPLRELPDKELRALRKRLQIVFQDPMDSMDPRWTVDEIVAEPLRLTDLTDNERRTRVAELLRSVHLPATVLAARPQALSAGQQQRVAIARAMATEPDFVVLDEPTSALTRESTREILAVLRQLQRESGVSYLFISHDLSTVRFLCDRVAVMYLGQIVEMGTQQDVLDRPRHPYSKALLAAHLRPEPDNRRVDRQQRETLTGEVPSPVDLPKGCYLYGRCPQQQDRCREQPQELTALEDGRFVRCWRVTD